MHMLSPKACLAPPRAVGPQKIPPHSQSDRNRRLGNEGCRPSEFGHDACGRNAGAHREPSRKVEEPLDGIKDRIPSVAWGREARALSRGSSVASKGQREAKVLDLLIALPPLSLFSVLA